MNYHHIYHAGNFADVIKHTLLIALIQSFKRKNTPFCYIDTHAGSGYYDLSSIASQKKKEYMTGVEKIIKADHPPLLVKEYLNCIHDINNQLSNTSFSALQYYPGSPYIAHSFIRPEDRIVACELQLPEYQALKKTFLGDKQVAVHHMDGYLGLKAFLPPEERRGFVLIDPPYENIDEYNHIAHSLTHAMKRFETGTYVIWYPIKEKNQLARFYRILSEHINKPVLSLELTIYPDLPGHLNGSGLCVVNPPWQFDQIANSLLAWLWNTLTINQQGGFSVKWLKNGQFNS